MSTSGIVPSALAVSTSSPAVITILPTSTLSSVLPTIESGIQDSISVPIETEGKERNQYLTIEKEMNKLKALLSILDDNGGIERVFSAVDDLGFQRSGDWDENVIIDSRSILHKIVKKICDDLLRDVEEVAIVASDAAAAADSSAILANDSAEIATAAALSVTNAILSFNVQAAVIPSSTSTSFSTSFLDSSFVAQKDTEDKKVEKGREILEFDDEISLTPTPKQGLEIQNTYTDISLSIAYLKEENDINNVENILLIKNIDAKKDKNVKIDMKSNNDLNFSKSTSDIDNKKKNLKSNEELKPAILDSGSESRISVPKDDVAISKIHVTPAADISSKNHRISGRDENREKEEDKKEKKDLRSPLQIIRNQRNLEEEKQNNKKDFHELKKEILSLKSQMISQNEINLMLTCSSNFENSIHPLSDRLKDFILNTFLNSTILPISFTTEIMKLKNEINLQLNNLEKQNLFVKNNIKNEFNGNTNLSQKDKNAFAWKPEVARITDSVKKLTSDQEESLNQVKKIKNLMFI